LFKLISSPDKTLLSNLSVFNVSVLILFIPEKVELFKVEFILEFVEELFDELLLILIIL